MCQNVAKSDTNMCQNMCLKTPPLGSRREGEFLHYAGCGSSGHRHAGSFGPSHGKPDCCGKSRRA